MRRSLFHALLSAALWVLSPAGVHATAEDNTEGTGIPIILLDTGLTPSAADTDRILPVLGGTPLRGSDIGRVLSLDATVLPRSAPAELLQMSQNLYFEGQYDACGKTLEQLLSRIDQTPELWITESSLRDTLFMALAYIALVAKEQGSEEQIDAPLRQAARRFPELKPSTRDFPPWLLERHTALLAAEKAELLAVSVDIPEECHLFIDGKATEITDGTIMINRHAQIAHATCPDGVSRAARISGWTSGTPWRPVFLSRNQFALRDNDAVLQPALMSTSAISHLWIQLGRSGGWPRIAVISRSDDDLIVQIVETARGTTVHSTRVDRDAEATPIGASIPTLQAGLFEPVSLPTTAALVERKWYRDPLAWALVGTGIAAFTTGMVLGLTGGRHTPTEPAAITLQITGAATAIAGGVLFFVPSVSKVDDQVTASLAVSHSF